MSSLVISSVGLKDHVSLPAYLHAEKNEEKEQTLVEVVRKRTLFCLEEEEEEEEDSSESSSIGAASSSSSDKEGEGVGEEEEVESKRGEGALGSLDALEESLPIKYTFSLSYLRFPPTIHTVHHHLLCSLELQGRAVKFLLREIQIICELIGRSSQRKCQRARQAGKPLKQTQENSHGVQGKKSFLRIAHLCINVSATAPLIRPHRP